MKGDVSLKVAAMYHTFSSKLCVNYLEAIPEAKETEAHASKIFCPMTTHDRPTDTPDGTLPGASCSFSAGFFARDDIFKSIASTISDGVRMRLKLATRDFQNLSISPEFQDLLMSDIERTLYLPRFCEETALEWRTKLRVYGAASMTRRILEAMQSIQQNRTANEDLRRTSKLSHSLCVGDLLAVTAAAGCCSRCPLDSAHHVGEASQHADFVMLCETLQETSNSRSRKRIAEPGFLTCVKKEMESRKRLRSDRAAWFGLRGDLTAAMNGLAF